MEAPPRPGQDSGPEKWKQPPPALSLGPGLPGAKLNTRLGCVVPLFLTRSGRNKTGWLQKGK